MVREIVGSAVQIKLKIADESSLISVYEFCYAAGYALKTLQAPKTLVEQVRALPDFEAWKKKMLEVITEAAAEGKISKDGRLARLLCECRIRGTLSEDALALFEMGLT